eukprot:scaffold1347_cov350-Pavlova_lutheri.AAC.48
MPEEQKVFPCIPSTAIELLAACTQCRTACAKLLCYCKLALHPSTVGGNTGMIAIQLPCLQVLAGRRHAEGLHNLQTALHPCPDHRTGA